MEAFAKLVHGLIQSENINIVSFIAYLKFLNSLLHILFQLIINYYGYSVNQELVLQCRRYYNTDIL